MLFNSIEYLIFLPVSFLLYWFVFNKKITVQNFLLLALSYLFYGWWDWRFLSLIIFSSIIDYTCGLQIEKSALQKTKKYWLLISMIINLGFLGIFKYFNFFSKSLSEAFESIGYSFDTLTLDVILPVGISFYTFQTMSYTIDVYNGKLKPTKDVVAFFAFVSFFPQLVAGPIERATNLLPQFYTKRRFDYKNASDGLRQILWGLFKKIVIADNCAIIANQVFDNNQDYNASSLAIGALFFTFQIYGDFSGYSDIAIGTSRLFGFNLMQNFAFPYFSRDIAEFWRRWHISLSTWFRDYVYIPLGGSKGGTSMKIRNTFIIFIVSGFWHGANWTFIVWGALNAFYFLPLLLLNKNRNNTNIVAEDRLFINLSELCQIGFTFTLTVIAWIFFRASSVTDALLYIKGLFSSTLFSIPSVDLKPLIYIFILIFFEWLHRNKQHGLELNYINKFYIRWVIYIFIFLIILFFGAQSQSFIYFQF
ncbi:MBOAT family O-acyltransferase [Mariniflexile litorale]|uniref:MBOAT family O-acyltransferase n=1 Tax=Mariniflexile litorale TaxID=3045158 RepID=A0AAU7EF99_9FLAO|nr:MBOAT family O-acyltransferase [Mariniflexile sp. KMM 9835]MDQ8211510.1 MBOAT family O-acyltransferase [Mariniflexile sp. KMM 9835]